MLIPANMPFSTGGCFEKTEVPPKHIALCWLVSALQHPWYTGEDVDKGELVFYQPSPSWGTNRCPLRLLAELVLGVPWISNQSIDACWLMINLNQHTTQKHFIILSLTNIYLYRFQWYPKMSIAVWSSNGRSDLVAAWVPYLLLLKQCLSTEEVPTTGMV